MLINEFLSKDTDIFPESSPLIILNRKYAVCMDNNDKDTKHTRHITRIVHFSRNGEKWRMHKIEWCEGGLQLAEIVTKNVGETDLNQRVKYVMVSIEN